MPPAYYDGSAPVGRVERLVYRYLEDNKKDGVFTHEVDFIVGRLRVAKADAILMTPEDERRQREAHARRVQAGARARTRIRFGRLIVPPTLVIESLSLGHEEHDQETKRQWYAESGVPNYWLLHAYRQSLECLVLEGGTYRIDQAGRGEDIVRPSIFPGLAIPLAELWDD
jgi:Uma2 family endonuclease